MTTSSFFVGLCAWSIMAISVITLIGYAFGYPGLSAWVGVNGMAFNTSINFILISVSMLVGCKCNRLQLPEGPP